MKKNTLVCGRHIPETQGPIHSGSLCCTRDCSLSGKVIGELAEYRPVGVRPVSGNLSLVLPLEHATPPPRDQIPQPRLLTKLLTQYTPIRTEYTEPVQVITNGAHQDPILGVLS